MQLPLNGPVTGWCHHSGSMARYLRHFCLWPASRCSRASTGAAWSPCPGNTG